MNMDENRFYVYAYLDPRKPGEYIYGNFKFGYEPFYIGKGSDRRYKRHHSEIYWNQSKKTNPFKVKLLRKIVNLGLEPIIVKVFDGLYEDVAFFKEIEMICAIGRRDMGLGPLTNLSDGGSGPSGAKKTEETLMKMSKTLKDKYRNGEMKTWNKGMKGCHSKETIENIKANVSLATRGKKKNIPQETKDKISKTISKRFKGVKLSQAHRDKMKAAWVIRRKREKELGVKRKKPNRVNCTPWNKGLTKDNDVRVAKQGWKEEDKNKMRDMVSESQKGRKHSEQHILNYIASRKNKNNEK